MRHPTRDAVADRGEARCPACANPRMNDTRAESGLTQSGLTQGRLARAPPRSTSLVE